MIKRFLPIILCLSLVLPAYTGSLPGNDPVPGKGQTSSPQGAKEQAVSIRKAPKDAKGDQASVGRKGQTSSPQRPKEQVIVIRTAPKDAKGDQVTLGKKGEILVPRSTEASRSSISATVSKGPKAAEEPTSKENEAGEEAKTAKKGKGANRAGDTGESQSVTGSMESGEDMAGGGFFSGVPGNAGRLLGGLLPSTFTGTTLPNIFPTIDTTTDTGTTTNPALLAAKFQALLKRSVSDTGVPGAILAVQTKEGVWIGAAGKADVDANVSMTPDMQVRIAGGTKVFTAALIMKLVEENKIALTDTVAKWLSALIVPGTVPYSAQITVAMLLNHTSGLHDYVGDQFFTDLLLSDPYYAWPSDSTYDEVIYWIYDSAFLPGTAFDYCNAGYYLLGKIAEAATGYTDTVENMVKTRFFDPLTMSKTTLTRGGQFEKTEPYTRGYCWIDADYYPTLVDTAKLVDTSDWDLSWDWTSGSGVSTAQDMLTWTKALFGGQLVNAQSLTRMTTPQDPSSFGFGLEVSDSDPWFGEKMYGHGGETPGVLARWLYYPDSGRTIFIALNRFDSYAPSQMDVSPVADSILSGVSSILLNGTP